MSKFFNYIFVTLVTICLGLPTFASETVGVVAYQASASPDGKQIVFTADYASPSSPLRLWVSDLVGTKMFQINTGGWISIAEEPAWSPIGPVIVFAGFDGTQSNIWSVSPDGSRLTQLTTNSLNNRQPAWSPDGSKIAFVSDRGGTNDIWVMNADGSNQRRLTTLGGEENRPNFSPDGQTVVFSVTANDKAKIMTVAIDGSNLKSITDGAFTDWNPSWGAKGIVLSSNRDTSVEGWKIYIVQPDGTGLMKLGDTRATDPVWTKDGNILYSDETSGTGALVAVSLLNVTTGKKTVITKQSGYFTNIHILPLTKKVHEINPNSKGKVKVAILSSRTFDAVKSVNQTTLGFGKSGSEKTLYKCSSNGKDVNKDGIPDLVCKFFIAGTGFSVGDTIANLKFLDLDGLPYQGVDSIRTVDQDDKDDLNDDVE
jgi:Tol biopolymer transport system component